MNEKDSEAPFPREPWKRMLERGADAPPETTDARIRASARDAIGDAPRFPSYLREIGERPRLKSTRWWLPASLAASFLVAVMVVHSQFGTQGVPVVRESDHAADARMDTTIIDRSGSNAMAPPPAVLEKRQASADRGEPLVSDDEFTATLEDAADAAGTGPRIGGPERELQAASEMPDEVPAGGALESVEPQYNRRPEAQLPAAPGASVTGQVASGMVQDIHAAKASLSPEAWYAQIEKLRAAGQVEEANRELERLKKAHPGWLEQHLKKKDVPR